MDGKKTISGLIVTALGVIFMVFDIEITEAETQELINQIIVTYGMLQTLYGRIVAKGPIKGLSKALGQDPDVKTIRYRGFTNQELLQIQNYAKNLRNSRSKECVNY